MSRNDEILALRRQGYTFQAIADELTNDHRTVTRGMVAGVVRRHGRNASKPTQHTFSISAPTDVIALESTDTDRALWQARLESILHHRPFVTVMHDNDIHFPYHDPFALQMRYEVARLTQPHIIVVGSDAFDYPTLSRFEPDADISIDDMLEDVRPLWRDHIANYKMVAPDAALVFIVGNHDQRAIDAIQRSPARRTLYRAWCEMVRQRGAVYWLGSRATEVNIGQSLIVAHGWKATTHTALAMSREYNQQVNVMAGHTHRPDYYTTIYRYPVETVIAGCACQLMPHYEKRKQHTGWQHGVSLATLHTASGRVQMENYRFDKRGDSLWCMVRGQHLTITANQQRNAA